MSISQNEIAHLPSRRPPPTAGRTDALPGRDLGVDHDAELIAGVEKGRMLRVV
jgi:hypothetical protein